LEKTINIISCKHAGKVPVFTRSVGIFGSISLGRKDGKRFVAQTSGGETELPSYTWPDKQVNP